ncbi:MAG: SEC59/DGK1/VTE5 family protein [Cyanobacteria bacterium]|nr:SEC59/DGK1/VTE5 family protein [Cyanobacteriota bacterium]
MIEWLGAVEAVEIKVAIAALWLALVGLTAIGVDRVVPEGSELVRKVVHIGTGNIVLLAWWMNIPGWIGVSAGVFFAIVTLASYRFQLLPRIDNVGRKSFGTFFYAVSIAVLVGWFWGVNRPEFGVLGILVMTWGDGLAGLVGKRFGRHRYQLWGMEKSWEGSLTMAIVATLVSGIILSNVAVSTAQLITIAFTIGILSAVLEAFSNLGIDNLTVPILSAAIAYSLVSIL